MAHGIKEQIAERKGLTDDVMAYFQAHPLVWIPVRELAAVGGFAAWRTRVSEARRRFQRQGLGTIEWNGQQKRSAYRFVWYERIGSSAETARTPTLFAL